MRVVAAAIYCNSIGNQIADLPRGVHQYGHSEVLTDHCRGPSQG